MATSHAEQNVNSESEKGIIHEIPLSEYAKSLDSAVRKRYIEKISVIGIDPLFIPEEKLSTECLPRVEPLDLVSYLVLETSFYTKDQFKNFRGLQAYNQMVSGFITSILGQIFSGKYVVIGKVRHSQRMNEPPVQLWIITTKDGTVLSAHCHGCMAGLGECCSHIASILFYLEVSTRLNEKLACTQVKCSWILPATVKSVDYLRVKDINFTSAKKMKSDLDKTVNSLNCAADTKSLSASLESSGASASATPRKPKAPPPRPSFKELDAFYESLSQCQVKPVCLSLEKSYAAMFISKTRGINPLSDLFDPKFLQLNYIDLLKECYKVEVSISLEEVALIERETVEQTKSNAFYRYRACRIGASKSRAASHTDPSQPSQSLIKSICYPHLFCFSTAATIHGCKHEQTAIEAYETHMKQSHTNFKVTKCGTFIDVEHPFLHATPDFLCECDCCGYGCGEVKCPYCIEGTDFKNYCEKKSSCLQWNGEKFSLKKNHSYYYQVQQQLHITKRAYCDFVVFSISKNGSKLVQERIFPDSEHFALQVAKLSLFWRTCILPEVLGRWYTRKMDLKKELGSVSCGGECYCRRTSNEPTATCSNPECPISRFHLACLSMKNVAKTWLCPHCRKLPKFGHGKKGLKTHDKVPNLFEEALSMESICVCKRKANSDDKLLKCHNDSCSNGKFFHLQCMSYKRYPNNYKSSWACNFCKLDSIRSTKSIKPKATNSNLPFSPSESSVHNDHEIVYFGTRETEQVDKYSIISTLTNHDFDVIESSTGWLENTVIQQAHVLLKQVNPDIQGFQRPSLGPCHNFDKVHGDFVQILHTGGNHWVCASSIGCEKGVVNLYDSLFNDVILDDLEQQVESLVGEDFQGINVVPIQQQSNGSDCGVFAIAFATSLVYTLDPNIPQLNVSKMRLHLYACLKACLITPFPTVEST
ncbi:uncharacterized protein LOC111344187 isoform X1 [Stylophora pistillata]|uniref:uncharacterized protein LOC111344187 isoform X1 n=1 Tax=Stylophora pistillata TaxID=50429 RepID=UPI000C04B94F|nr:uncharacterized protein LOC111344187 isoform X1 [Stylophora pistillata]